MGSQTSQTVSENLRRLRKLRDVTLRDLEGALEQAGHPLGYNALSRIEKGQRRVDVDDLTALAFALDVSPLALLLPNGRSPQEAAQLSGGESVSSEDAWLWALTKRPIDAAGSDQELRAAKSDPARTHDFRSQKPWWLRVLVEVADPEAIDEGTVETLTSRVGSQLDSYERFVGQLDEPARGAGSASDRSSRIDSRG